MSRYIDLKRIEFVVTDACSGCCKHCSRGERRNLSGSVDASTAVDVVMRFAGRFAIAIKY